MQQYFLRSVSQGKRKAKINKWDLINLKAFAHQQYEKKTYQTEKNVSKQCNDERLWSKIFRVHTNQYLKKKSECCQKI